MSKKSKKVFQQGNPGGQAIKPSGMAIIFTTTIDNLSCDRYIPVTGTFDTGYDIFAIQCNVIDKSISDHGYNLISTSDSIYYDCLMWEDTRRAHCGNFTAHIQDQNYDLTPYNPIGPDGIIYVDPKGGGDCPYPECQGLSHEMLHDCCYGQCYLDPDCTNSHYRPNCPSWGSDSNATSFKWTGGQGWYGSQVSCDGSNAWVMSGHCVPWWLFASSYGAGQSHCCPPTGGVTPGTGQGGGCSPHCGCTAEDNCCGNAPDPPDFTTWCNFDSDHDPTGRRYTCTKTDNGYVDCNILDCTCGCDNDQCRSDCGGTGRHAPSPPDPDAPMPNRTDHVTGECEVGPNGTMDVNCIACCSVVQPIGFVQYCESDANCTAAAGAPTDDYWCMNWGPGGKKCVTHRCSYMPDDGFGTGNDCTARGGVVMGYTHNMMLISDDSETDIFFNMCDYCTCDKSIFTEEFTGPYDCGLGCSDTQFNCVDICVPGLTTDGYTSPWSNYNATSYKGGNCFTNTILAGLTTTMCKYETVEECPNGCSDNGVECSGNESPCDYYGYNSQFVQDCNTLEYCYEESNNNPYLMSHGACVVIDGAASCTRRTYACVENTCSTPYFCATDDAACSIDAHCTNRCDGTMLKTGGDCVSTDQGNTCVYTETECGNPPDGFGCVDTAVAGNCAPNPCDSWTKVEVACGHTGNQTCSKVYDGSGSLVATHRCASADNTKVGEIGAPNQYWWKYVDFEPREIELGSGEYECSTIWTDSQACWFGCSNNFEYCGMTRQGDNMCDTLYCPNCNPWFHSDTFVHSYDCVPCGWIGDNYPDCDDQAYGADLQCYDGDAGDCGGVNDPGGQVCDASTNPECEGCVEIGHEYQDGGCCCCSVVEDYPFDPNGGSDVVGWLEQLGWNCSGCNC